MKDSGVQNNTGAYDSLYKHWNMFPMKKQFN